MSFRCVRSPEAPKITRMQGSGSAAGMAINVAGRNSPRGRGPVSLAVNGLARLIDANANRAREALRVMEDLARFTLDDPGLCGGLKTLRHELRAALDSLGELGLDRGTLLANRDTEHDVGTAIGTPQEARRVGLRDMALAAGGRLTEALRAIEEATKALGGDGADLASDVEALRYRAYTLEQQLALALGSDRAPQWRLCVLITASLCSRPWAEVAEAAIEGGADCLQLREKALPDRDLLERARTLVSMARPRRVAVVINDRPDLALLAGADGVHLGQTDLPVQAARRFGGDRLLIGLSTTNLDQARDAVRAGADYCGLGPMFPTNTKEKPAIAGPAYLRDYLADAGLAARPHLAIGGITPENAAELAREGCLGFAVSAAVCAAKDPASACRDLLGALRPRAEPVPG
jgi:thiamine-phosphate pyrophosphorylase